MADVTSKRIALFITALGSFLAPFMTSSVNIAIPLIGSEFQMDAVLLTWVATSFLLATAVFLVPFGKIADIHGRRKVFVCGISVFTISSLLLIISNSAVEIILLRIFQGIGCAMVYATSVAILTSVYPAGETGKALGINTASVYLGLAVGPFLGGFLTHNFGWRSIFVAIVPLGLALLAFTFWKLKGEWAEARGEKFDLTGSIFYGLTLVAVMYGFSLLPEMSGGLLILIGGLGILGFVWWERRARNPVLNMGLFRNNRVFLFSNLAALINYSATFAVVFLLSLYLQQIKGFNPQDAGLILILQPIVQTIFSPLAGRLSDKVEPRIIASIGMAATVVGLSFLAFLNETTTLEFIYFSLFILGFGFAFFASPNINAVMCSVERRLYGVASGTLGTMRQVGQMLSMGIAALVFAMIIGRVQITAEYYPLFLSSVRISFAIFAVMCLFGVFASIVRGRVRIYKPYSQTS